MNIFSIFKRKVIKQKWKIEGLVHSADIRLSVRADTLEGACREARLKHPQIELTSVKADVDFNYYF